MFDLNHLENRKEFAARIKTARKNAGMTQAELAEKIGSDRTTISQWECAHNLPDYSYLSKLCTLLNIDIGYLFGDYSENNYDIHKIKEITGLSEKAIETLKSELQFACLSYFLENENFSKALKLLWTMPTNLAFLTDYMKIDGDLQSLDSLTLQETMQIYEKWAQAQRYMANAIDDYIDNAEKKCDYPQNLKHSNYDWLAAKSLLIKTT